MGPVERADDRRAPGLVSEADRRLDLGLHRAGRELRRVEIARTNIFEGALCRLPPIREDSFDIGEQQQEIGADLPGEECAREILVDDRLDAEIGPRLRSDDRNAPSAATYDGDSAIEKHLDHAHLEDLHRKGRSYQPSPPGTVLANRPSARFGQ